MSLRRFLLSSFLVFGAAPAVADVHGSSDDPATSDQMSFACHAPRWQAIRRAVAAWCESDRLVKRRYYQWTAARTKRKACADLPATFERCEAEYWDDYEGSGPAMRATAPVWVLTYWVIQIDERAKGTRIRSVDFEEDCTGP